MRIGLSIFFVLCLMVSSTNALVYYQQDWSNNGGHGLYLDNNNAPFDPDALTSLGNSAHNVNISSTVISSNFVISCKHWTVGRGCRLKTIGNESLYQGRDGQGKAIYSDIYVISDYRDLSSTDFRIYKIKHAISPDDPNFPEPNEYDWLNDPNGYLENANLSSYMPLYNRDDELDKESIIAGYGPQRIFGVNDLYSNSPYDYEIGSGILHWGYNQIHSAVNGAISIQYDVYANAGTVPNEVGVGVLDSGTGIYIYDDFAESYALSGTFWNGSASGGITTFGGPRVSAYIDQIAQHVNAMGAVTLSDKILGGLKPQTTISTQIENSATELNPVDTNTDEVTVTMTIDNLSEFISGGAVYLYLFFDVPVDFNRNFYPQGSDFMYNSIYDKYICSIGLAQINPNDPVIRTGIFKITQSAEPMTTLDITPSLLVCDSLRSLLGLYPDSITCNIANWSNPASEPGTIYVDALASESTSGTSWEYPYQTLQEAFARAIKTGSGINQIWMAAGTYTSDSNSSFAIDKDMAIYGGFAGGETSTSQRYDVANKTIITVADSYNDVFWMSTSDAPRDYILDGLTIVGSAQNGINLYRCDLELRHCIITGNGTAIAGDNTTIIIDDSILSYNCRAIDISYGGIVIDKSIFSFNDDTAITLNTCGFSMANSVVSENGQDGMDIQYSTSTELINCDIVNNYDDGIYGLSGAATEKVANCIVYGNGDDTIPTGQFIINNVQSNPPFWFPYTSPEVSVNYLLGPIATGCIDSGNNSVVGWYSYDLYGRDRVINNTVDVGAVESLPVSPADFNVDSIVNLLDFAAFTGAWGTSAGDPDYNILYDIYYDGTIDIEDMISFADQWMHGIINTGTVTSKFVVDFGYSCPDLGMLMSTPSSMGMMDTVSAVVQMDSITPEERLAVALERLVINESTLAKEKPDLKRIQPVDKSEIVEIKYSTLETILAIEDVINTIEEMYLYDETFQKEVTEDQYKKAMQMLYDWLDELLTEWKTELSAVSKT